MLFLFNLWGRHFYPGFFKVEDAEFHAEIDLFNLRVYRGTQKYFVDIAFRGAAKTTRTKLFVAFAIANDLDHFRKSLKVLASDGANSKQVVTDVYNMLILPRMQHYYPEIFMKTNLKRQETMGLFMTTAGVKMEASVVGVEQRGDLQGEEESSRPDFIWFDDFETRTSLRSLIKTKNIWENMEEAREGLAVGGGALYNCNYLSERGNVHKLVLKDGGDFKVLITPIIKKDGSPTWPAGYTQGDIESKRKNASDWAGEYLCEPSVGFDVLFDRRTLTKQEEKQPWREIGGFKMFHEYDPSHRYGSGHDTAGGVGLDSCASVFIDFSTIPSRVVATFANNTIKPSAFGDEIESEANRYGRPIVAVENNKFDAVIERLRMLNYDNLYFQEMKPTKVGIPPKTRTLGWNTNADTKPKMLMALKKAVEDGHLELSDPALIADMKSYTRDDLMDPDTDPRLTTRHFDLLMAAAIAYWMKDYAEVRKEEGGGYQQPAYEPPTND